MTIGIAAYGPGAGRAIIKALAAVEAIGNGAIGGFVSLVVIGQDGRLHRAEAQRGGSATLFDGPMSSLVAEARHAVLMSSGPDRPEPLAQFTPGDANAGLVTGHRFPNAFGVDGLPLNEDVLARLRAGVAPAEAIAAVLSRNADADAGLIALSPSGEIYAADSPVLDSFGDRGSATLGSLAQGAMVAVLHNAISPWRGLALVCAETALDFMLAQGRRTFEVVLPAGIPVRSGTRSAVDLDEGGTAVSVSVGNHKLTTGSWSFGLGYQALVRRGGVPIGRLLYEPYLVARDGVLRSIDGGLSRTLQGSE